MITLFNFGRRFGLPDASPFVAKVEMLLKLAKLEYRLDPNGFRKAPKGKLPYIDDDGVRVADSSFIRIHLQNKYMLDFDNGLNKEQRSVAWAFEKMCEDHLYWISIYYRWMDDDNFAKGPAIFFKSVPAIVRPVVTKIIRRQIGKGIYSQGMGRHSDAEKAALAALDLKAISSYLADKPYFMGSTVSGADATIFPFVAGALCPLFTSELQSAASKSLNLVSYNKRMMKEFYPELSS